MAKKKRLSFDELPAAVERVLEILSDPDNSASAIPELIQRISLLENKIDYLQKTISPDSAMMDMQTVCRILKIRPKVASDLAASGALPSRREGRSLRFFEDGVVKYYMTHPTWSSVASKPDAQEQETVSSELDDNQHVNIQGAGKIVGRSAEALYQLTSKNKIPFHRMNGKNIYFIVGELREWLTTHPPRKRRTSTK